MDDLDAEAIKVMKQKYAEKNENPGFEVIPDEQALKDLDLLVDGKLNYAALVLLGKSKAIRKYMPQNNVVIKHIWSSCLIGFLLIRLDTAFQSWSH
jgi:ATP-dependent DNA helicase RecG